MGVKHHTNVVRTGLHGALGRERGLKEAQQRVEGDQEGQCSKGAALNNTRADREQTSEGVAQRSNRGSAVVNGVEQKSQTR